MNVFAIIMALAAGVSYNSDLPPAKYQFNTPPSVIIVVNDTNTKANCGVAKPGWRLEACTQRSENGTPVLIVPNPCGYPEALERRSYAHLLCHEFGHANGWNSTHNN